MFLSVPLIIAGAHFLGRDVDPFWAFYLSPLWAFGAGLFWQKAGTDRLICKLRKTSGLESENAIRISSEDLAEIRNARHNVMSIRHLRGWGLLLVSTLFFSPLASTLYHWIAGVAGMLIGAAGGFLIGLDLGEHVVAVVRDERIRGERVKPEWFSRIRSKGSERYRIRSRSELAAWAMMGPFLVFLSWSGSTVPSGGSSRSWLYAIAMAVTSGIFAMAAGSFSKRHLIVALHRGELDDKIRPSASGAP